MTLLFFSDLLSQLFFLFFHDFSGAWGNDSPKTPQLGNHISAEAALVTKQVAAAHDMLAQSITEISGNTMDCLQAIEKSEENVLSIERLSKDAEKDSKQMQSDMSAMVMNKEDIVAIMQSVSDIAEEIVKSVDGVSEVVNDKMQQVDLLVNNAESLNKEAEELSKSMERFKI